MIYEWKKLSTKLPAARKIPFATKSKQNTFENLLDISLDVNYLVTIVRFECFDVNWGTTLQLDGVLRGEHSIYTKFMKIEAGCKIHIENRQ